MKKLSLLAVSASAALICAAVPLSCHWSPATAPSVSVDRAEASPSRQRALLGLAGEQIGARTAARQRELRLEPLLLEAPRITGDIMGPGQSAQHVRITGDIMSPDLR